MPFSISDPFDNVFKNSVLSLSTPIFNGTNLIGIYGAHFNADYFFQNLIDPMLGTESGISYWVFPSNDLANYIHTNV